MKEFKLSQMKGGWFAGDFLPTCLPSPHFEVACKKYSKGDKEAKHVHKVATEITLVVAGAVRMNGKRYSAGDIIMLEPGESADFEALEDAINVVVKSPCVKGDKYPA
jgi:quercetin dioxygenase-like cupin family protein